MLKYRPNFADSTNPKYHLQRLAIEKAVVDTHRKTPEQRGYGKDWWHVRWTIASQRPACAECGAPWKDGREDGHHVDHIERFDGIDDPKRLDPNNLQPLCHSCHSRKTARKDGGFGNKRWP